MQRIKLETIDEYTKRLGMEQMLDIENQSFYNKIRIQIARAAIKSEMWDKAYKGFSDYEKNKDIATKCLDDFNDGRPLFDLAMNKTPNDCKPLCHPNCQCTWDTEHMEKWGPDYYRTSTGYIIGGDDGVKR